MIILAQTLGVPRLILQMRWRPLGDVGRLGLWATGCLTHSVKHKAGPVSHRFYVRPWHLSGPPGLFVPKRGSPIVNWLNSDSQIVVLSLSVVCVRFLNVSKVPRDTLIRELWEKQRLDIKIMVIKHEIINGYTISAFPQSL